MTKLLFFYFLITLECIAADNYAIFSRDKLSRLALDQSNAISHDWDPAQRDCSGFVRYLFRKTVFKIDEGFVGSDGKKVDYLSAKDLILHNFTFISKEDFSAIETGDIFVFYRDGVSIEDSWHLMIALNHPLKISQRKLLIYHNGNPKDKNAIKKVWLDELVQIEAGAFRPVASNSNFLGIYRWKGYEKN